MIIQSKKGESPLNKKIIKELPAALLAGGISGIITLVAFLFIAPSDWYFSLIIAAAMTALSLWKAVSDSEKNEKRYKRDEKLITEEWFCAEEGFIRTDSDRPAKFFFSEKGVSVLRYKNVKPIVEFIEKEKITGRGTDRCGWLSFIVPEEKLRIVFEKEKAFRLVENLTKNGWE